ncbi:MAG: DNA-binding domain-containing protein [Gammaproteobacteria bacterium]|nr:DNA-binding domain-containing protein [Gammaproteobacteria bacterium]
MSELNRAQQEFQQHLMAGDSTVVKRIVGDARAPAQERLDVYYQAYRLRLIEVLENDFAGLKALLGDDFAVMVNGYLHAHPSQHPSVRWFGRRLQEFLATVAPWCERFELAEMAAFEWAWGQAFDAADAAVREPDALARISPDAWADLQLELHPSLRFLQLRTNVPMIFGAVARDESMPDLVTETEPVDWLVWRRDLVVRWRSLTVDEAWALQAIADGASFAQLCEGLCDWHDVADVPIRAASFLRGWLTDGLITRISTN